MKLKFVIPSLLVSSLLAFTLHAVADDSGGDNEDHSEDCSINGSENVEATVVLTATTNAPDGATGSAKLDAENDDGNENAELKVETSGLDAGDYVLSIVRISDGSTEALGTITVGSHDCGEGDDTNELDVQVGVTIQDNGGDNNGGDSGDGGDGGDTNHVFATESELTLPSDINPMDIAQIVISDTNGVPFLVGDFTAPQSGSSITFNASIQVQANGSAAGTAHFQGITHKGKWKKQFLATVSGLAANTTFDVNVNGQVTGKARSNKNGQLTIKKLPAHVTSVHSLQLTDSTGVAIASAKF